jgi:hypothetical protein
MARVRRGCDMGRGQRRFIRETASARFEVYDLESTSATHLVNISTRASVGLLIGGFIIDGQGRSAGAHSRHRTEFEQFRCLRHARRSDDRLLSLLALILSNDNWKANIENTGIPPINDKESASLGALDPGSYTAFIGGKNKSTLVALVEVYRLK